MPHMGEIYFGIYIELVQHNGSEADQHLTTLSFKELRFNWDMGCSRILLGDCDETFSKRRHNRINDTEVSWKAVTTVTFFRFFESSDKRHSYIERAGQIFRLRYTFTRKKGSEIWVHSEALL